MKNTTILLGIAALVVLAGTVFFIGDEGINGNVVAQDPQALPGETQRVVISERDLNYYPSEIKVKANKPVEISLDGSVGGCLRSFTIRDLGVSKYLKTPSEKLTFTPTKKGTYTFSCSMGMGYGKLVVE